MAVGIWPIEHYHHLSVLRRCFHDQEQGAQIRVESCSNILDVEQNHAHILQAFRSGLLVRPVQTEDREARFGVCAIADVGAVVLVSAKPVLRRENFFDIDAKREQGVDEVGCGTVEAFANDGRLVGDDCDSRTAARFVNGPNILIPKSDPLGWSRPLRHVQHPMERIGDQSLRMGQLACRTQGNGQCNYKESLHKTNVPT